MALPISPTNTVGTQFPSFEPSLDCDSFVIRICSRLCPSYTERKKCAYAVSRAGRRKQFYTFLLQCRIERVDELLAEENASFIIAELNGPPQRRERLISVLFHGTVHCSRTEE